MLLELIKAVVFLVDSIENSPILPFYCVLLTAKKKTGCGNGKYLGINPTIFKLGSDRCISSVEVAKAKDHEVTFH